MAKAKALITPKEWKAIATIVVKAAIRELGGKPSYYRPHIPKAVQCWLDECPKERARIEKAIMFRYRRK